MVTNFRSMLFVPGSRAERFGKALAAGADAVIIDLEDAVLPNEKAKARTDTLAFVGAYRGRGLGLRINSPRTVDGCADIAALAESGALLRADFVMVPKTETAVDLEIVSEALRRPVPLIAVVESGRALSNVFKIAAKSAGGILFGGADYSASLSADLSDWDAMLVARSSIAAACGTSGVPAYDVPFLDVKDGAALLDSTSRAKRLGFSGRACIHPDQVAHVNGVFSPSEAELSEAHGILEAIKAAGTGAALYKGRLVDRPIKLAAERVLARAKAI
jgi:citrate lyase subunit beta/citryl-CoA lyase/(S)-citramalyl-CoA lyase